jgi:hypothetical protein
MTLRATCFVASGPGSLRRVGAAHIGLLIRLKINKPSGRQDGSDTHMDYDLVYSFVIGVTGAILFLFVDRLEPNRAVSSLLKFLVLFVSSIIIMQKLRSNGLSLF